MLSLFFVSALCRVQMERDLTPGSPGEDWVRVGSSDPTIVHPVGFSFRADPIKRAKLEDFFWRVSNPQHEDYGKYFKGDEGREFLAASEESVSLVTNFLARFGVTEFSMAPLGDYLRADVPIGTLEQMMQTEFSSFRSEKYDLTVNRVSSPYYLPDDVAEVIALVDMVLMFPGLRSAKRVSSPAVGQWANYCGTQCAGKITPNITAQQYESYSISGGNPMWQVASGNGMAVAEFQTQKYDTADLSLFTSACNIKEIDVIDPNGNAQGQNGGLETMLDLEYISGNSLEIPLSDYFYLQYSLLNFGTQVNGQKGTGPLVYSVSYGNDEVQQTSTNYMFQCNTQFMMAGTYGYTILFASGDQGVWGRSGPGTTFHPDFPGGSPYILTVGGTDWKTSNPHIGDAEKCCIDGGGGFSNTFTMPSYQNTAVQAYITAAGQAGVLPAQTFWNASGRAYPDISANFGLTVSYCVADGGRFEGVGGTSASCPTVAHGIAVLNNIQLSAGKSSLGFLNPWIYQTYASTYGTSTPAFNDVVGGQNNEGVGTGFTSLTGWDPCSGVGTPNFANMAKYLP